MLHNQVLKAIPRQKVKHKDGTVGEVLGTTSQYPKVVYVKVGNDIETITMENCEPVPEEPRGFRCGDNVYDSNCGYTTIVAVRISDVYLANGVISDQKNVRHATHQERKDYFLND